MKHFIFYGRQNGGMLPLFNIFTDGEEPTKEMRDAAYNMCVQQAGLGVPRPVCYSITELHELAADDDAPTKPVLVIANGNGVAP